MNPGTPRSTGFVLQVPPSATTTAGVEDEKKDII